jgi:hypothetical protein
MKVFYFDTIYVSQGRLSLSLSQIERFDSSNSSSSVLTRGDEVTCRLNGDEGNCSSAYGI